MTAARHVPAAADAPFRDLLRSGGEGPDMLIAPAGSFRMGASSCDDGGRDNERPQIEIAFERPFALGRFPVTFDEYDRFARAADRPAPDDFGFGRGARPVINVSWLDAYAYCAWLTAETGVRYALPSEAQWEYACRAGVATPYSTGADITTAQANFDPSSDADPIGFRGATTPVGAFAPNDWGFYDMHGNVAEWCADRWRPNHEDADPRGAPRPIDLDEFLNTVVVRGGGWSTKKTYIRASERYHYSAEDRFEMIGFRVCRENA